MKDCKCTCTREVVFTSKKKLAKALLKGRVFKSSGGGTLKFDNAAPINPFRFGSEPLNFGWKTLVGKVLIEEVSCCCPSKKEKRQQTLDEALASGKELLCWVNDQYASRKTMLALVVTKETRDHFPYVSVTGSSWCYATPLTKEEIKKYSL